MIVTVTYNGNPHGQPMNDLREDDLLWFIKSQGENYRRSDGAGWAVKQRRSSDPAPAIEFVLQ